MEKIDAYYIICYYITQFKGGLNIMMPLDKLRYLLTEHIEKFMFTTDNYKLLIHPSVKRYSDLLNRIMDDIDLMPEIEKTIDNVYIKFYTLGYKEELYYKSELISFIYVSINPECNVIKGFDINKKRFHFWLKKDNIIFDQSLAIITSEEIYSKKFKQLQEIENKDIYLYLSKNNNLWRFYHKNNSKKDSNFSLNFIRRIVNDFNESINNQYVLDEKNIEEIKDWITHDNFIRLRQVLTQKRKSYLQSNQISLHPSVDENILEIIKKASKNIQRLMKDEYDLDIDYYNGTIGNCYALSILLNLYDGNFKLIQGAIPYKSVYYLEKPNGMYQHSWLEIGDYIYDPALRIITLKELYYRFVKKQDEYSKEDTENILRRIGFNLTHFRDFMNRKQIGGDETIRYRMLVNKIDSPEFREEGEKLLALVRKIKQ